MGRCTFCCTSVICVFVCVQVMAALEPRALSQLQQQVGEMRRQMRSAAVHYTVPYRTSPCHVMLHEIRTVLLCAAGLLCNNVEG